MEMEGAAAKAVTESANKPQEKVAEDQLMETALCGRIEELECALRAEREYVKQLKEELEEGKRRIKELESTLRAEKQHHENSWKVHRVFVKHAENEAHIFDCRIKLLKHELEQVKRTVKELETTIPQRREELLMVRSEERFAMRSRWGFQFAIHQRREEITAVRNELHDERGSCNQQIYEQEDSVRGAECYNENVEAAPHGGKEELNGNMKCTNSVSEEGEPSPCGKVKKLAAVSVAVGLVVVAGWWFLS
jgi:chromosome segregation ATPase